MVPLAPRPSDARRRPPSRRRRRPGRAAFLGLAAAFAAALAAAVWLGVPRVEEAIKVRIEGAAARRGITARVESVRLGLWPPLRLTGLNPFARVEIEYLPGGNSGTVK